MFCDSSDIGKNLYRLSRALLKIKTYQYVMPSALKKKILKGVHHEITKGIDRCFTCLNKGSTGMGWRKTRKSIYRHCIGSHRLLIIWRLLTYLWLLKILKLNWPGSATVPTNKLRLSFNNSGITSSVSKTFLGVHTQIRLQSLKAVWLEKCA